MKNVKKLKILLVTDRMSYGGAETHILTLYHALSTLGHSVTVASSGGALAGEVRHFTVNLTSHSLLKMLHAYFSLYKLARSEKYDLIHAHARLPALIASFVARRLKIPLVATVHARFKIDFLRRRLSAWGFRSIAVSEDLRLYLSQNYDVPSENITVIENGIDFEMFKRAEPLAPTPDEPFNLLFLSRLDGDCSLCADILCEIAPRLANKYKNIKITVGGGGECFERIKAKAQSVNRRFDREVISTVGKVCNVSEFLSSGNALIGVSRCAIEGIASQSPVIIAGNEGFLGRLTTENFSHALCSNFCARGEKQLSSDALFKSICEVIDDYPSALSEAQSLYKVAKPLLDLSALVPKYEQFYLDTLTDYTHYKEKNAKTLLFGYYGFSNLGDDALLNVAIKRARSEYGATVGALTKSPKQTAKRFAIPCYSRSSPFSVAYRIFRCDRLIFGGGTVFQDGTSRRSLIYYLTVLKFALFLRKDVILYANGIGQIESKALRRALFRSLSRCIYIGVRDERSYKLLKKALPKSASLTREDDLSMLAPISSATRARFLIYSAFKGLNEPMRKCKSFFLVCPHFRATHFDKFELDMAIKGQKNKGLTPLFVPCSPEDRYLCKELNLKFGGGMIGAREDISFSDLAAITKFASHTISMRYHPLLAARVQGVESTTVGADPKICEFKDRGSRQ